REPSAGERAGVIIVAAKSVGRSLFFALLVITVSFIPVFSLTAQEGRLFKPLAFTKTFSMFFAAFLGVTLVPVLMVLLIRGKITPEIKKIPEAVTVFGKAGQADTPTDPAPLSMFETVVTLKTPDQWRKGMTWDRLLAELNANIKTPGMANIFWMPIQTRTEMLTTGFRSILGVKVFGPDLGEIQRLAVQIEKELADFPNTRSVFAERTVGGYFLDFTVNREAAARY